MCAQRMFRAGLPSDTVRSQPLRRDDERQGVLDLRVLPTYRSYSATRGWIDKVDEIQMLASAFADRLLDMKSIGGSDVDESDAARVNADIAAIAKAADALIGALIQNAESRGLQASGRWMEIPLVECREFELEEPDAEGDQVDDALDRMKP